MNIKYLGHSAFEIETKGKKILIDPFLVAVPNYKIEDIYDIKKLIDNHMLEEENGYLRINDKYLYISNEILCEFI